MKAICIIPVKGKGRKSRLSIPKSKREKLTESMFLYVAGCASKVFGNDSVFIVTSSEKYKLLALSMGINVLSETASKGVNEAVRYALKVMHADRYFILPSDLPILGLSELKVVKNLSRLFDVVICPSFSFDGTNILAFRKEIYLTLSYDMNSFWNHLKSAAKLGAKVCVLSLPGIMNDLDTLEDIKRIAMTKINSGISEKIRRIWKQRRG